MIRLSTASVVFVLNVLGFSNFVIAGIVAPSLDVQVYTAISDPVTLTFDSAGNVFVGRDNVGSGGGNSDAVRIHRVGLGGSPVVEYGDEPILDPDAVVFDAFGAISGTPGSVLVGGGTGSNSMARLTAIRPDESISVVFTAAPNVFNDINEMSFDGSGRLLLRDDFNIFAMTGPSLSTRSTIVSFGTLKTSGLAVGPSDELFVGLADGTIRSYAADGSVINGSLASGLNAPRISHASNALFQDGLYALDGGRLFYIDASAADLAEIANGIDPRAHLNFGPDGALYISEFSNDRILRLTPIPEPSTFLLLTAGLVFLVGCHRLKHSAE